MLNKTLIIAAIGLLAACAEIMPRLPALPGVPTPPTQALALYGGTAAAVVPQGYCIETKASRPSEGFAVMVACEVIAGEDTRPSRNGFITVQVGPAGSAIVGADPDAFQAFVNSTAGEDLLSANGDASAVAIRKFTRKDDAVMVRFTDIAAPLVAGLQNTEWRAFVDIRGRLTTISVRGIAATPLTADQGQALLEGTLASMLANNADPQTPPET